jgi:Mrp family chromosome partitioning ATPase
MLDFFRMRKVRVLGGVENMTTVECPHCQHDFPLFRGSDGRPTIWDEGVSRLASLPFSPDGAGPGDGAGLRALADRLLLEFPAR